MYRKKNSSSCTWLEDKHHHWECFFCSAVYFIYPVLISLNAKGKMFVNALASIPVNLSTTLSSLNLTLHPPPWWSAPLYNFLVCLMSQHLSLPGSAKDYWGLHVTKGPRSPQRWEDPPLGALTQSMSPGIRILWEGMCVIAACFRSSVLPGLIQSVGPNRRCLYELYTSKGL